MVYLFNHDQLLIAGEFSKIDTSSKDDTDDVGPNFGP